MTWITIDNVQRAVTPKAGNSELRFLCFANSIMVIYICIKFRENISVFKLQNGHKYISEAVSMLVWGLNSEEFEVTVGVYESSVLSPLLFIIEPLSHVPLWGLLGGPLC